MFYFLVVSAFLPESPRWLIGVGRFKDAAKVLNDMAEVNGVETPKNLEDRIAAMPTTTRNENSSSGYLSLFQTKAMAIKTICVGAPYIVSIVLYVLILVGVGNMSGNIFINMAIFGIIELPGYWLGIFLSDRFGRRWTHSGAWVVITIICIAIIFIVQYPELGIVVTILSVMIKFFRSVIFTSSYVQAMEIFPTCVRQTGMGLVSFASNLISIGGPYVMYLGTLDYRLPYLILTPFCLLAVVASASLPETMGKTLPETIEDASFNHKETVMERNDEKI